MTKTLTATREIRDGNLTLIVESQFDGTKSLADIFEDLIIDAYRREFYGTVDTLSA
jgi:hypothetical protein